MPSFTVRVHRVVEHDVDITVTAKDEDAAQSKVEAIFNNPDTSALSKAIVASKTEWELDDESYEVTEVNQDD